MTGGLYVLAVLTALLGEFVVRGNSGAAVALIAVPCYIAVTLLLYAILKPVNRSLSLLAMSFNLLGLVFEALRLNPRGVDIALVFHGLYCLLIGCIIFRSTFLPPILGLPMEFAGLGWLTFLKPELATFLSPYNLALGILGEAALMLWFLAFGVNVQRWKEQSSAAYARRLVRLPRSRRNDS
jgi:hypothetical protein